MNKIIIFLLAFFICNTAIANDIEEKIPLKETQDSPIVGTETFQEKIPLGEEIIEEKIPEEKILERRFFLIAEIVRLKKIKITKKKLQEAKLVVLEVLLTISEQLSKDYLLIVSSISRNPLGGGKKSYHSCEDPAIGAIDCWIEKKDGTEKINLAQFFLFSLGEKLFKEEGIKILELFGPSDRYWIGPWSERISAQHENHVHCAIKK